MLGQEVPNRAAVGPGAGREPSAAVCPCGGTDVHDVAIHAGRTVRRDCARCGRFLAFVAWCGRIEN